MSEILHLIEFQMTLLLFIALAGYLLASRVNQSAVIGEIVVGLLVGPSVLGLITYTGFVSGIARLGAIFLKGLTLEERQGNSLSSASSSSWRTLQSRGTW